MGLCMGCIMSDFMFAFLVIVGLLAVGNFANDTATFSSQCANWLCF